ncbi:MAG: hypothetical protein J5819_07360 [Eubacterium sp.]|nr:hypothetical protein [Eubacterium sp.]
MEEKNERINSPEKLDRYLRVIRPSMWIAFAAVFAVIAVIIIWACMTEITVNARTTGYVVNNRFTFVVDEDQAERIREGQQIRIGTKTATVLEKVNLGEVAASGGEESDSESDEITSEYAFYGDVELTDGVYNVEIQSKGVKAISFLFG